MPTINWETESDWDESVEDSGFAHESVADTANSDASVSKRAYSYTRHPLNLPPAIPDSEVESFEWYPDQSISDRYGGETGAGTIVQSNVVDGSNALELVGVSGGGGARFISDTTNLSLQTDRTYRYSITPTVRDGSGFGAGIHYFTQDETSTPSGYHPRIQEPNNDFELYKASGGSFSLLDSASATISLDTTYAIEFEVDGSTDEHTARLYDESGTEVASVGPVVDATHTGSSTKGVGWRSFAGTAVYDYLHPPNL